MGKQLKRTIKRALNKINEPQYEYKEILVLKNMLDDEGIPYVINPEFGGYHLEYPCSQTREDNERICSVIEHNGSYGREVDKLEIMGLLTDEEYKCDTVAGYLTAEDVFNRIKQHYESLSCDAMGCESRFY